VIGLLEFFIVVLWIILLVGCSEMVCIMLLLMCWVISRFRFFVLLVSSILMVSRLYIDGMALVGNFMSMIGLMMWET